MFKKFLPWVTSPIATAKKKIALWLARKALTKLRNATKNDILWLTDRARVICDSLESFARKEISPETVLRHIETAYDSVTGLLKKLKK